MIFSENELFIAKKIAKYKYICDYLLITWVYKYMTEGMCCIGEPNYQEENQK